MPRLKAEMTSTTAKPSWILARNRKLGSQPVSDCGQARFDIPTPDSTLSSGKPMGAGTHGAPTPVGKVRAQWIKGGKFGGWVPALGTKIASRPTWRYNDISDEIPSCKVPGPLSLFG